MNNIRFTTWSKDYNEAAINLYIDVFSAEPWNDILSLHQMNLYFERILNMNTFIGYAAFEDTQLIGVSLGFVRPWFGGIQYHLDSYYISNHAQGKGIGTKFLDYIKDDLFQGNIPNIALDTTKGFPAEYFYKKNGFTGDDTSVTLYAATKRS